MPTSLNRHSQGTLQYTVDIFLDKRGTILTYQIFNYWNWNICLVWNASGKLIHFNFDCIFDFGSRVRFRVYISIQNVAKIDFFCWHKLMEMKCSRQHKLGNMVHNWIKDLVVYRNESILLLNFIFLYKWYLIQTKLLWIISPGSVG